MSKYFLYVLFIYILSFGTFLAFSQDISVFRPSSKPAEIISEEDFLLENTINDMAEMIKKEYFYHIYGCLALRQNDLSVCNQVEKSKDCRMEADLQRKMRKLAEGDCAGVEDVCPVGICTALDRKDCSSLKGKKQKICQGIIKRDLRLLPGPGLGIMDNFGSPSDMGAEEFVNIYYGFKNYSFVACDRFTNVVKDGKYGKKLSCKVLFGNEDPQETIDNAALDLAYLDYVKNVNKDITICDKIKDGIVREACKNPEVKSFSDLLFESYYK